MNLKEVAFIKMEALGILQYDSGLPFSEIRFVSDLKWVQRRLIKFNQQDNRYNKTELSEFDIPDILRIYTDRDCEYLQINLRQMIYNLIGKKFIRWNRDVSPTLHPAPQIH